MCINCRDAIYCVLYLRLIRKVSAGLYGCINGGESLTRFLYSIKKETSQRLYFIGKSVERFANSMDRSEGFDMFIQSPVYSGNHLYYIGAGHNGVIGNGLELEVWNLYYENACAPALQRIAADDTDVETSTEVLLYPNPFNTELSIDLSSYTEDGDLISVAIEVVDAIGKTIYKSTVLSELNTISTTDWAQGMYVVKIKHNNFLINKKVVKY